MTRVRFSDVVTRANTKEDRFNTTKVYYVGGEHIDSEELMIHRKGLIAGSTIGPMFYCGFKAGQILFVTRNPHLKKCSKVDFDGICSEKTFVLDSKDQSVLLQDYLICVMQSDDFWSYCEENKSGGVNYFLNWSTLANYEFDLPPLSEQKLLAEKLWAAYKVKQSYLKMIEATDEMVKSQFIEMFDLSGNSKHWPVLQFNDFAKLDCKMTTDFEFYANYPHIGIDSIEQNTGRLYGYRTVSEDNVKSGKYIFTPKHIIYSKIRPNLNKVATPDFEGLCSADSYPVLANEKITSRRFLAFLMRSEVFLNYIVPLSNRTGMPKANRDQVEGFACPMPPKTEQDRFVNILEQADKSKFELRKSIEAIDKVIKSLINENL